MKAQTTESENTDTQVFSVYISIASVKENRVRFSAQLRSRSASAAYNALPCIKIKNTHKNIDQIKNTLVFYKYHSSWNTFINIKNYSFGSIDQISNKPFLKLRIYKWKAGREHHILTNKKKKKKTN